MVTRCEPGAAPLLLGGEPGSGRATGTMQSPAKTRTEQQREIDRADHGRRRALSVWFVRCASGCVAVVASTEAGANRIALRDRGAVGVYSVKRANVRNVEREISAAYDRAA